MILIATKFDNNKSSEEDVCIFQLLFAIRVIQNMIRGNTVTHSPPAN